MEVGVVDGRVALDRCASETVDLDGDGVADRQRHLRVRLGVLQLLREADARGEVDQLAVVEWDQRVRYRPSGSIHDGELGDERRLEQFFDGRGKGAHVAGRYRVPIACTALTSRVELLVRAGANAADHLAPGFLRPRDRYAPDVDAGKDRDGPDAHERRARMWRRVVPARSLVASEREAVQVDLHALRNVEDR